MQGFHVPTKRKEHRLQINPSESPSCPPMPRVVGPEQK